jgi:gamma-glutamyltranspeptidase/glutathione hydrolase
MPRVTRAVIATGSPEAAAAGAQIAHEGGNAVDIAVAAALAASITETLMCSLGGSAFVMARVDGHDAELFDGGDAVPGLAKDPDAAPPSFREVELPYGSGIVVRTGHATIAVPGALAGLELAWRTRGTLPWDQIAAPAVEVARQGYRFAGAPAQWLSIAGELLFRQYPASRTCFFKNDRMIEVGDLVKLPGMNATMEAVAAQGAAALYRGDLAAAFQQEMCQGGGLVTGEDLASYRPIKRTPRQIRSGGFHMALNPAPAIGGPALAILLGHLDGQWKDQASEAERALIHARAQKDLVEFRSSAHTTHLSVATADGSLAAITMSNGYGSGVVVPGTGITCNSSLGEPELNPKGYGNAKPGTRLMSNMTPTVAWHTDGRRVAMGSPGASRITTALAQVWSRSVHEGLPWTAAVTAPRLHIEPVGDHLCAQYEPGLDMSLVEREFTIRQFEGPDMFFGAVQLAAREPEGRLIAVADARRSGSVEIVG